MSRTRKIPYEVGYRRPPKSSQFQPGQSGNPSGRPKHTKPEPNLRTSLVMLLSMPVPATERGKRVNVTALDALLHVLYVEARKGSPRAMSNLLRLIERVMPPLADDGFEATTPDYGAEVRQKLEQMAKRISESKAAREGEG